jgi:hypothetical protein
LSDTLNKVCQEVVEARVGSYAHIGHLLVADGWTREECLAAFKAHWDDNVTELKKKFGEAIVALALTTCRIND